MTDHHDKPLRELVRRALDRLAAGQWPSYVLGQLAADAYALAWVERAQDDSGADGEEHR
jgi:hypothetical protein